MPPLLCLRLTGGGIRASPSLFARARGRHSCLPFFVCPFPGEARWPLISPTCSPAAPERVEGGGAEHSTMASGGVLPHGVDGYPGGGGRRHGFRHVHFLGTLPGGLNRLPLDLRYHGCAALPQNMDIHPDPDRRCIDPTWTLSSWWRSPGQAAFPPRSPHFLPQARFAWSSPPPCLWLSVSPPWPHRGN
mgnify:CR=1 FL=1